MIEWAHGSIRIDDISEVVKDLFALEIFTTINMDSTTISRSPDNRYKVTLNTSQVPFASSHWSREFEYPWALRMAELVDGLSVLDAGGGLCPFQLLMALRGANVVNVEIDRNIIAHARRTYIFQMLRQIRFAHGDILNLDFPDGTFDRTVCISVLEHCRNRKRAFDELYRVTKPGGRLIVTMDVMERPAAGAPSEEDVAFFLEPYGLSLPPKPSTILRRLIEGVSMSVLCVRIDKP